MPFCCLNQQQCVSITSTLITSDVRSSRTSSSGLCLLKDTHWTVSSSLCNSITTLWKQLVFRHLQTLNDRQVEERSSQTDGEHWNSCWQPADKILSSSSLLEQFVLQSLMYVSYSSVLWLRLDLCLVPKRGPLKSWKELRHTYTLE